MNLIVRALFYFCSLSLMIVTVQAPFNGSADSFSAASNLDQRLVVAAARVYMLFLINIWQIFSFKLFRLEKILFPRRCSLDSRICGVKSKVFPSYLVSNFLNINIKLINLHSSTIKDMISWLFGKIHSKPL